MTSVRPEERQGGRVVRERTESQKRERCGRRTSREGGLSVLRVRERGKWKIEGTEDSERVTLGGHGEIIVTV